MQFSNIISIKEAHSSIVAADAPEGCRDGNRTRDVQQADVLLSKLRRTLNLTCFFSFHRIVYRFRGSGNLKVLDPDPATSVAVGDPWHFGADPDPYLWVMDSDSDPTLDPTPFFSIFKDAKKNFFIFCSYNLPTTHRHINFSFWLKFCVKMLFC